MKFDLDTLQKSQIHISTYFNILH